MKTSEELILKRCNKAEVKEYHDARKNIITLIEQANQKDSILDPEQRNKERNVFVMKQLFNVNQKNKILSSGRAKFLKGIRDIHSAAGLLEDMQTVIRSIELQDIQKEQSILSLYLFDGQRKEEITRTDFTTCFYFLYHAIKDFVAIAEQIDDNFIISLEEFYQESMTAITTRIAEYGIYPEPDLLPVLSSAYNKGSVKAISEELELFGI